jgi:hypothetical protein
MKKQATRPHKHRHAQNGSRSILTPLFATFCLMLAALFSYSASAVAATATFSLVDNTTLQSGSYKIYVAGYSATPGYYLNSDGTWLSLSTTPPTGSTATLGQIPCWQLGSGSGQINKVVIDSTQTTLSARLYYFVVTDTTTFPVCSTSYTTNGIFKTALPATTVNSISVIPSPLNYVTLGGGNYQVYQPSSANLTGTAGSTLLPLFNFGEIGPGASSGTIDLSQVDFFSFPMNIKSSVTPVGTGAITNPAEIGNPLGLSYSAINSVYTAFMNNIAGTGGCTASPTASACAYLSLSAAYSTPNDPTTRYYWVNPGSYLQTSKGATSGLNTVFNNIITKTLWANGAPSITLDNGGIQGPAGNQAPQETFASSVVSMAYPCNNKSNNSGCPTVQALKFVGQTSGYIAYIFSPYDYDAGCTAGTITGCAATHSPGYQVFAGAGVFATTNATEYTNLVAAGVLTEPAPTMAGQTYTQLTYTQEVARLGLIMTQALNHGVASMTAASCGAAYTWQCWNVESNWYPTQTSTAVPDITQNLFSQFMHTAQSSQIPLFVRPPSAVTSAGGSLMGMAYGFSNDENPTPVVTGSTSPEVPSKMDQTVQYGGTGPYTITLGPWTATQDCVFNWAQTQSSIPSSTYYNLFPSSSAVSNPTQTGVYNGRTYTGYRTYSNGYFLGVNAADNDVYYGVNGALTNAGDLLTVMAPQATGCMTTQMTQANCFFSWAETSPSALLSSIQYTPTAVATEQGRQSIYNSQDYIYRYYPSGSSIVNYLGINLADNNVYSMQSVNGANGTLVYPTTPTATTPTVANGALSNLTTYWAPLANCQ